MFSFPKRFILLDTEYTSWEDSQERGWGPNKYKEIIQIGAISVDGKSLAEEGAFSVFVKPVKNPQLSDFIVGLTGITQEKIDTEGISLPEAMSRLGEFVEDLPMYAYGTDGTVIIENCALVGTPAPFAENRIINMRSFIFPALEKLGIDPKKYTSGTLITAFGKPLPAPAHDAVNDMRNLLAAIRILRERSPQPF